MLKYAFLFLCFLICGCASSVDKYLKDHPETSDHIKTSMNYKIASIGMDREQLAAIKGKPDEITKDDIDEKETWIYFKPGPNQKKEPEYYAFEGTKIVRMEDKKKYNLRHIEKYFKDHPERIRYKETAVQGKVKKGMNTQEVKLSLGAPKEINKNNTSYSTFEQWIYEIKKEEHVNYLYFSDDKLLSWQE
ncbi:MAG TPA: hypothetical protein PLU24_01015 [Candidatus Omnitrophota bacterium]|nr:hypothetical protein [Candidatus Omnitrophota bacterium]